MRAAAAGRLQNIPVHDAAALPGYSELLYQTDASILFGTNTFLKGYARHAHPYDFKSLKYVLAGARETA